MISLFPSFRMEGSNRVTSSLRALSSSVRQAQRMCCVTVCHRFAQIDFRPQSSCGCMLAYSIILPQHFSGDTYRYYCFFAKTRAGWCARGRRERGRDTEFGHFIDRHKTGCCCSWEQPRKGMYEGRARARLANIFS